MKKVSAAAAKQSRNISQPKLTIGLDLADKPFRDGMSCGTVECKFLSIAE